MTSLRDDEGCKKEKMKVRTKSKDGFVQREEESKAMSVQTETPEDKPKTPGMDGDAC